MTNKTDESPLAGFLAGLEQEETEEQADLVGMLFEYDRWRAQETSARAEKEKIAVRLRRWLDLHPADTLWDGERGIEARLQTRTGAERYDVAAMPAALVKALHNSNALTVDVTVLRALAGKTTVAEDVKPYRVPGMVTMSLEVKVKS